MAASREAIEGAAALDAMLAELDTSVATRIGVQAGRASAKAVHAKLVAAAPYRPGYRQHNGKDYGHLRDNIKVRRARSIKSNYIVFEVTTGKAFWSYFLEFGTENMPAQPWARPVVEGMRDDLVTLQIDRLRAGIDRIAKGIAKGKLRADGTRVEEDARS